MKPTISSLKKKCDTLFSRKIRLLHANDKGFVNCYTCGRLMFWKDAQCGHYVSRQYNQLRYCVQNSKPQCSNCNVWRRGNYSAYAAHLVKDSGPDILEWYETERRKIKQYSVKELLELHDTLEEEVNNLSRHVPDSLL